MKKSFFKRIISVTLSVVLTLSCFVIAVSAATADVTVKVAPNKTVFYQGLDWNYVNGKISVIGGFDLSGTQLTYNGKTYSYYVDDIFGPNIYAKSSNSSWYVGNNTAKIFCDDIGSTHYATITFKFVEIDSIEVSKKPVLTDLIMGTHWKKGILNDVEISTYDLTGLELKANYKDSTSAVIKYPNTGITWSVDTTTELIQPGPGKIFVYFAGKSASFDVNYLESEPTYLLGDVNFDTKISSYDALLVLEYAVNVTNLSNTQLQVADVSKDNVVNSTDALYILQKVVGSRNSF